ncbi:MAG: PAS domain-containing protein [Chlorobi bacterium]|nr:PAS domain-containing protein [Chlorobiota bacterium]
MTLKRCKSLTQSNANEILNCIADGVFTTSRDLKITFFNKAAEKITGVKQEEAVGHFCFEVLRANICEKDCTIMYAINKGKERRVNHINILRPDRKQIPIMVSASPLKDENGNVVGGVETFRDLSAIESLRKELKQNYTFEDIISKNHKILDIFSILPNIAESESTVLIQGPSGSGKELFARAIHNLSFRKNGPFIPINCSALPDSLLESELFGYVQGAFTDAKKDKPGRFALAEGGTIFLDEVDSLSPATQVKLLRVLQEKEYEPLGATESIKANVRVISATKKNLMKLVQKNEFRDDLYFRLDVVKIELPSLAERRDDIPLLINHFVEKFNHKTDKLITGVSNKVLETLMYYDFPGNVRELENIIEHAFVMCSDDQIKFRHLPLEIQEQRKNHNLNLDPKPIEDSECKILMETLEKHNWNKLKTAEELRLHRTTLWRKMQKYGLIDKKNNQ